MEYANNHSIPYEFHESWSSLCEKVAKHMIEDEEPRSKQKRETQVIDSEEERASETEEDDFILSMHNCSEDELETLNYTEKEFASQNIDGDCLELLVDTFDMEEILLPPGSFGVGTIVQAENGAKYVVVCPRRSGTVSARFNLLAGTY